MEINIMKEKIEDLINYLNDEFIESLNEFNETFQMYKQEYERDPEYRKLANFIKNSNLKMKDKGHKILNLKNELLKFKEEYVNYVNSNNINENKIENNDDLSYDDFLTKTLNGEFIFNKSHKYYNDSNFKSDLMNLCIMNEKYELASLLK